MLSRVVLASVALSAGLQAQTAANLTGTVRDPSGAVLTEVKVAARQTDTGTVRETRTGPDGRYTIAALSPGTYEVRAERPNFRPLVRKGIDLTIGATATLDLALELGAEGQEVTVEAQAPGVNISTSELSYLVAGEALRELPLNGRNWTDLSLLQPGVIPFPHRDGGSAVAHGLAMSINGQEPRANMYLLDGTPLNDFTNGPAGSVAGTA
ncbi:MAG TPA: carboxypeptidase-like regulatory domain-containing protein, partial [Bryobacteraceae bacterium]|nr:carboxypeptidase-like regulatory domain-containing protein [Bryobacteraceae bacterium]